VQVDEIMTRFPASVRLRDDLRRAAELFAVSEVGQLMVLDDEHHFVGILSEGDVVRALLPDAGEIRGAGGSVSAAFTAFLSHGRRQADLSLDDLVLRDPVTVAPDDHVAAAAVLMTERGIRRLPVVRDGRLCGTVSRTDLCRAVLAHAGEPSVTAAPTPAAPPPAPAPTAQVPAAPAPTSPTRPSVAGGSGPDASAARTLAARMAQARTPEERLAVIREAQAARTAGGAPTPDGAREHG
jgi:CBS domain-containing protein